MGALGVPAASLRLAMAIRYWHSARLLLAQQIRPAEFMEPIGHLLSMTAELALKAYLLERRLTDRELGKKVGHDLGIALLYCVERGLALSEYDVRLVLVMRTAHLEHYHRYGPSTFEGGFAIILVDEEKALQALARIIDLIAGDPRKLRHLHERPIDLDWPPTSPPTGIVTVERLKALAAQAETEAKRVEKFGAPHSRKRP